MSRSPLLARWVGGLLLGVALTPIGQPALGQTRSRIDLVSQTTVVTDDAVEINLRIPSSSLPQQLEIRVGEPIDDLGLLDEAYQLGTSGPMISRFTITNIDERRIGTTGIVSVQLPDDEIGLILRRSPGVLPVTVELLEDGALVDTLTTSVVVEEPEAGQRLDLGFAIDTALPLSHLSNGLANLDPDAVVDAVAASLEIITTPGLILLRPEALTSLDEIAAHDRNNTEPTSASVALARLSELLDDHDLALSPWVPLDEEAWRRAGAEEWVLDNYRHGTDETQRTLGRSVSNLGWLDQGTTPELLVLLREAGLQGAVIEPDQLVEQDQLLRDARPAFLSDANGNSIPFLPINRESEQALNGVDPELLAHQQFGRLWLRAWSSDHPQAMVIDPTKVSPAALAALLDLLGTSQRLGTAPIGQLLSGDPALGADGSPFSATLTTGEVADYRTFVEPLFLAHVSVQSYQSMLPPEIAETGVGRNNLRAAMAEGLTEEQRQAFLSSVSNQVAATTEVVRVREPERITLATTEAYLPVVVDNTGTTPLNVKVVVSSDKLRFPEGISFDLAAEPGINELGVPVESVGSGDARLQIAVLSPDGGLLLATGTVSVRSTALSELGLLVTLFAGAVLVIWWARTIRRHRRTRLAANFQEPHTTPTEERPPT